jgi:bifunctional UDP-N-acetylglucosamine pyrophosphorylase / glucosamine-1-phosphate N-acetyltransferase
MQTSAIILAAGQGTRMRSSLAKVLHTLAGRPLIQYCLDATSSLSANKPVLVVGHGSEAVREVVGEAARFVYQEEQLGTAHAVLTAETLLAGESELVLVTNADMPLITRETLTKLVHIQESNLGPIAMLTLHSTNPRGFGRIIRGNNGEILAIVEEAQATPQQRLINELNAAVYCFRSDWLWENLHKIGKSSKGEYYLTDTVALAVQQGHAVQGLLLDDPCEAIGINTRSHLAEAEHILQERINNALMLAGVTMRDPSTVYVDASVTIGEDTVILPNTHLQGITVIGEGCIIGPNSVIADSKIGNHCKIVSSMLEKAILEDHVEIGPFGHLRKGAYLSRGVHMGNFGEVKNSKLGEGVKIGHFSYIGDAQIGEDVNIGAGTITCNFDGSMKHPTEIGAGAFIGSDTMLVAPVKIGRGARTGAGSVVTHDVPPNCVVVGVPARPLEKNNK